MQRIIVDDGLRERLSKGIPVELCDDGGNVIAVAWPGGLDAQDVNEPPIDIPEIKRMIAEEPTYSTEEVIRMMQEL